MLSPVVTLLLLGLAVLHANANRRFATLSDGCKHVLLDLHPGNGDIITHLFSSSSQASDLHAVFNIYFGTDRKDVCLFAFEDTSNDHHAALTAQRDAFASQGFRVVLVPEDPKNGLSAFFNREIVDRALPEGAWQATSNVVLKANLHADASLVMELLTRTSFCDGSDVTAAGAIMWRAFTGITFIGKDGAGKCKVDQVSSYKFIQIIAFAHIDSRRWHLRA